MIGKNWQISLVGLSLLTFSLLALRWERRIDACLGDCHNVYRYWAGRQPITLTVTTLQAGDNGGATVTVTVAEKVRATVLTTFNYDTLLDQPAGYVSFWWRDRDLFPDLLLLVDDGLDGQYYYVGTLDGQLYQEGE